MNESCCAYRKAHTAAAKEWLKRFEVTEGGSEEEMKLMRENPHSIVSGVKLESKRNICGDKVPVLVCLTFADRLLVRDFMEDSGHYDRGEAKKGIAKHFEVSKQDYDQILNYFCKTSLKIPMYAGVPHTVAKIAICDCTMAISDH